MTCIVKEMPFNHESHVETLNADVVSLTKTGLSIIFCPIMQIDEPLYVVVLRNIFGKKSYTMQYII